MNRIILIVLSLVWLNGIFLFAANPPLHLKSNGMRVGGEFNYFFVGPSGDSIRSGFNTEQPNALLDFNKGTYPFFYISANQPTTTTDLIGGNAPTMTTSNFNFLIDASGLKGKSTDSIAFVTSANTDVKSLYFGTNFVGIYHGAKQRSAPKFVPSESDPPFSLTDLEASDLDSEHFNPDITGSFFYGAASTDYLIPFGNMDPAATAGSNNLGNNGLYITGGQYGPAQLYAQPKDRRDKSAKITFGFPYMSDQNSHYFAIYVDGQPAYFEDEISEKAFSDHYKANVTQHKTFVISHPMPEKPQQYLVHSALEGPDARVFYYGTAQLINGECVVDLPDYFESLTHSDNRQLFLTSVDADVALSVKRDPKNGASIQNGQFVVIADSDRANNSFNWRVTAVRKDIPQGDVEPLKSSLNVKRKGPYTYAK